jgi:protein PhnA
MATRDSNGAELQDGDSVQVIKDLKVKGTSSVLKRGTMIKNIRLTDDDGLIECNAEKIKGLVLKTEFLKKV